MRKVLTIAACLTFATLINTGFVAAEPAQPGADRGAHCNWTSPFIPDGAPGTLQVWLAQLPPTHPIHQGKLKQAAAHGVVIPGSSFDLTDDQKGANGDVLAGLRNPCNLPVPTP